MFSRLLKPELDEIIKTNLINIDINSFEETINIVYSVLQKYNYLETEIYNNYEINAESNKEIIRVNINGKQFISYIKLFNIINYQLYIYKGEQSINNLYYLSLYFANNGFYILGDLYFNKFKPLYIYCKNIIGPLNKLEDIYSIICNKSKIRLINNGEWLYNINGDNKAELLNYYLSGEIVSSGHNQLYSLGCYYYYFENDINSSIKYFGKLIDKYSNQLYISEYKKLCKYSMKNLSRCYLDIYNNKIYFEEKYFEESYNNKKQNELLEIKRLIDNYNNYYDSIIEM